MLSDTHPELHKELEALADRSFRHERAIGTILGKIADLFVDAPRDADVGSNWKLLPYPDADISRELDLRCVDSGDGLITVICAMRDDVLYVLSAGEATGAERAIAVATAVNRVRDLSWADPA